MKIEKFVTGIISTNCYIVTNEETKETVIVDPANLSKAMIGYIEEEELVIKAILLQKYLIQFLPTYLFFFP